MKKKNIIIVSIVCLAVVLIGVFSIKPIQANLKEHETQRNYLSLMKGQKFTTPEELLKDSLGNGKGNPIYLVIYKRSCPICQEDFKQVQTKINDYKKSGATILVTEAPQEGKVATYPTWVYQFRVPDVKTPVLIRYDLSQHSNPIPLAYSNFEHYYGKSRGWITQTESPN